MPTPIGTVFNDLAIKAGVKPDDVNLKSLLSSPELVKIEVPDEIVTAIDSGLLNIDAAKNNHPAIKTKYFADAYDGFDRKIAEILDTEDSLTDDEKTEIKAEKSTGKKIELVLSKLKAAHKKAAPADKAAINQQIADLHEAARKAKEEKESTVKEYEGKIKNIRKDAVLSTVLANYKTIYDELDPGIKTATLTAIINKTLQDNNAVLDVDDNGALILVGKDGNNVFGSNHTQLTPQSFLDKSLAPILKVSTKANTTASNGVTNQQPAVSAPTENASLDFIKSHNQKMLAEMQQQPVSIV